MRRYVRDQCGGVCRERRAHVVARAQISAPADDDLAVTVGQSISTRTGQTGTVIDVNNGNATIEFKHPLAGKTLTFTITVVDIQKAR